MSDSPGRPRRRARQGTAAARAASRLSAVAALALLPGALLVIPAHAAAAQQPAQGGGRIAGTVLGTGNAPVADVQVVVTTPGGVRLGAITNAQGRYNIGAVPAGTVTVRTQRIGFQPRTQTVSVTAGQVSTLDFQLTVATTQLTAVQVVGYTNEQRRDVSGAVATVTGNEVRDQKVATIEQALRGRVPGVQVQSTGQPGRPSDITIRGQNSLGTTSPLYVVDGMYVGTQNPNINPDDIASFNILKDASAAAQYGAQASNGVIVITTRRGQAGQTQLAVSAYYGVQQNPKTINLVGSSQWQQIYNTAYTNSGAAAADIPTGITTPTSVNTNWQNLLLQTGGIQNYNLQALGGTPSASYLISGSVFDQKGTIITTAFRRYSIRANSQATRGRFTVGENLAASQGNSVGFPNGLFGAQSSYPLQRALNLPPVLGLHDPNNPGGWGYGNAAVPTDALNPVAAAESYYNKYRGNQVLGSAFANVSLLPGLSYRLNLGVNYADSTNTTWNSATQIRRATPILNGGFLNIGKPTFQNLLYENLLTYDASLGGGAHRISAVAGQTSQNNTFTYLSAYRQGFANQNLQQIAGGSTAGASNNGFSVPFRNNSLLARATYAFKDRYLATASTRRDCSTRFSPADRCGVFGAGSLGWVVSEEGFFKSIPLLGGAESFKLRASTGVLGDQNINDFGYLGLIALNRNYGFGGNGNNVLNGATLETLTNPQLKWQRNRSVDVGFDLNLFSGAVAITADYYRNTADQLLVNVPLPPSLGSYSGDPGQEYSALNPAVNAGKVRNAGFEFGLTHRMGASSGSGNVNGFSMNTTFSFTANANRVLALGYGNQPINVDVARTIVGQPIASFYVFKSCGIFQSTEQIAQHPAQAGAKPGDTCYQDVNGNGTIDDGDRYNAGNGTPKVNSGLFFEPRYGPFDFGLNFRGSFGFKIVNYTKLSTENTSTLTALRSGLNFWSPSNTTGTDPQPVFGAAGANNFRVSDRYVENGNFVRIQNLVVGYTLPASVTRQLRIGPSTSPRVYVNIQNLATFTKYSGYDPEVLGSTGGDTGNYTGPLTRGIDYGATYPNPRTYTFGFDLRF